MDIHSPDSFTKRVLGSNCAANVGARQGQRGEQPRPSSVVVVLWVEGREWARDFCEGFLHYCFI